MKTIGGDGLLLYPDDAALAFDSRLRPLRSLAAAIILDKAEPGAEEDLAHGVAALYEDWSELLPLFSKWSIWLDRAGGKVEAEPVEEVGR